MLLTISLLRAQRSNQYRLSCRAISLLAMTILISACKAETPQASHELCTFTWMAFEENMNLARENQGFEKIYYAELTSMNVDLLLAKGCCKYSDTCPAAVMN